MSMVGIVLVLLLFQNPVTGPSDAAIEESLSRKYVGQSFWVRDFRTGWRLRFDSDGTYLRGGNPGLFGVDGNLHVDSVDVNANRIELRGRRAFSIFDPKTRRLEPMLTQDDIRLEFLRKPNVAAEAGIDTVLLTREELPPLLAPYWSRFVLGSGDRPRIVDPRTGVTIPTADPSTGLTPRIVKRVSPFYPEQAKRLGFGASVVLRVVVDESGKGQVVDIVTPAGLGLDQAAIDVIDQWVFEPASSGGKPVKVYIRVRFDFNPEN